MGVNFFCYVLRGMTYNFFHQRLVQVASSGNTDECMPAFMRTVIHSHMFHEWLKKIVKIKWRGCEKKSVNLINREVAFYGKIKLS